MDAGEPTLFEDFEFIGLIWLLPERGSKQVTMFVEGHSVESMLNVLGHLCIYEGEVLDVLFLEADWDS